MLSSARPSLKTYYAKLACSKTLVLAKQRARNTVVSKLTGNACSAALRPDTTALEHTTCASTAMIIYGVWARHHLSKTVMASIVLSVSRILNRQETQNKVAFSRWVVESVDPKNSHFSRTKNIIKLSLQITCLKPSSTMSENQ